MKKVTLILFAFVTGFCHAQNCTCTDQFTWLKETMEKNDAGFQHAVDRKGVDEYNRHTAAFSEKVKSITDKQACADTLAQWLKFFRKGHLWIGLNPEKNMPPGSKEPNPAEIRKQFKTVETYSYREKDFNAYLSTLKQPGIEGVWTTPPYTIGIRKVKDEYIGFVIEADGLYWSKGQVKLRIRESNGKMTATYYMKDHSARTMKDVSLLSNNFLQMDWVTLKRVKPSYPSDPAVDQYFRLLTTEVPLVERLDEKTMLLRIPSFDISAKKNIDSVIKANFTTITSTENLVIDLRDNGGGSDGSFEKILPLICTNPIRTAGVEFLSTPMNNKRMQLFNGPEFSDEDRKWAKEGLEKLNKHPGEFVNLDSSDVSVEKCDTMYPFPKNVGIIIHENNGSTTEQFLLAARQSRKVKLFGTSTAGVLDISNMHFVNSPCDDLKLGYSLSRSMRIPHFTIDNTGIQPDFYIDKSIPAHGWIGFVTKILHGN